MVEVPSIPVLEEPVWFNPLRRPTWLLPPVRDGATRVGFVAEHTPGEPDRDLLVGLPSYLAEGLRFSTEAAIVFLSAPVAPGTVDARGGGVDASVLFTLSFQGSPEARRLRLRLRLARSSESVLDEELGAGDGPELAGAIADLPRRVIDSVRSIGVAGTWAPVYAPPSSEHALRYLHGHRACLQLGDEALYPPADDDPEIVSARRTIVRSLLSSLADLAQRAPGAFPALLYFGGLAGAHAHGSDLPLEFRLPTNAICMEATDPRDIAFRLSTLVLRLQGDAQIAERRAQILQGTGDPALMAWLRRAGAVR